MENRATLAVILAGGEGRRMNGADKARLMLGAKPLVLFVRDALMPQAKEIAVSCHDNPDTFADLGLPVITDPSADRLGPIGGILAALDWAALNRPDAEAVMTVAADTPFLPHDLYPRLRAAKQRDGKAMAAAASGGRIHPVIALWPLVARATIRARLAGDQNRALMPLLAEIGCATADWPDGPQDPFFNINTAEDLQQAQIRLTAR